MFYEYGWKKKTESEAAHRTASTSSIHQLGSAVRTAFRVAPTDAVSGAAGGDLSTYYRMHISPGRDAQRSSSTAGPSRRVASTGPVLNYWCFNPGVAMMELQELGVRSIIVTSGTLSPLSSFATELATKFDVRLENPHVIEQHQLFVGVVKKGPDGVTTLCSTYQNRITDVSVVILFEEDCWI